MCPSIYEPFGLVVLEAMACEIPVVASRVGGIPEIVVDGETGFLVEERDVEGMARRMTRLILEPELAAELGRAGRRRMQESFSIDSRIARLWEIIRASAPACSSGSAKRLETLLLRGPRGSPNGAENPDR